MIFKITPKQAERIHRLVKELCANCIDGNCLLLDCIFSLAEQKYHFIS